jgi:hypothetical protein
MVAPRKPLGLILSPEYGRPIDPKMLKKRFQNKDDVRLVIGVVIGYMPRTKLPLAALQPVKALVLGVDNEAGAGIIKVRIKTWGPPLENGLKHGEYTLVIKAADGTCPVPSRMLA